jgi:hypothetical protein
MSFLEQQQFFSAEVACFHALLRREPVVFRHRDEKRLREQRARHEPLGIGGQRENREIDLAPHRALDERGGLIFVEHQLQLRQRPRDARRDARQGDRARASG